MQSSDFKSMSVDQLWALHEELVSHLGRKIAAEKNRLEERLRSLHSTVDVSRSANRRRAYPRVLPKYRNPRNHRETWAGRGKQPRWLAALLKSGKKLEDLVIR